MQQLVESVVVGPAFLAPSDLHNLLGVTGAAFRLAYLLLFIALYYMAQRLEYPFLNHIMIPINPTRVMNMHYIRPISQARGKRRAIVEGGLKPNWTEGERIARCHFTFRQFAISTP